MKKQMVSRQAAKTAKNESNLIALFFALFASLRGTSSRREVRRTPANADFDHPSLRRSWRLCTFA
jgi:hypothetical protein